jgi:hypothetical protein
VQELAAHHAGDAVCGHGGDHGDDHVVDHASVADYPIPGKVRRGAFTCALLSV